MKKIFVIGKIGCGKSLFCKLLKSQLTKRKMHASVLDLDRLGHNVLQSNDVSYRVMQEFGTTSRDELGKLVFDNPSKLEQLVKILHPYIYKACILELLNMGNLNTDMAIVEQTAFDGSDDQFIKLADKVIYLDVDENIRKERCLDRGMTQKNFDARNLAQLDPKEYIKVADNIIQNNTTEEDLICECNKIIEEVYGKRKRK